MEDRDEERGAFMWADKKCDDFEPKQKRYQRSRADVGRELLLL